MINKQISAYRQYKNELFVYLSENVFIEVPMEINYFFKIEMLLEATNLVPNKAVLYKFYRFFVGDLEIIIGVNEDVTPITQKVITVIENDLLLCLVKFFVD